MSKRLSWLDCCKGATILLVVLGHVADGYLRAGTFPEHRTALLAIYNLIYAFHMPLFYCLSGYVFYLAYCQKRAEKQKNFWSQIVNLTWIYIVFSVVLWGFKMLFADSVNTQFGVMDFLMIPIKPLGEFWYVYVLIFIYLIAYVLEGKCNDKVVFIASYVISSIVKFFSFEISFPLKNILYYFFFFYLGVCMAKRKNAIGKTVEKIVFILSVLVAAGSWSICLLEKLSIHKIPVVCTFVGTSFCVLAVLAFSHYNENRLFSFFGKYSLEIYTMHTFLTAANRSILIRGGVRNFALNVSLNFIISTLVPVMIAVILKKLRLHKWIFKPVKLK